MGFFGGSTTYVSSVVYNMAGDVLERPNFLKTAIVSNTIFPTGMTMGENLRHNYLRGPGIRTKSFFRWARINYEDIGVPAGTIGGTQNYDRSIIAGQIPADPGKTVLVQVAEAGPADYSYWAEQYMFEHHMDLIETEWTSDISETSGDITITFEDTTTVTFTPVGFDKTKSYLYIVYSQASEPTEEAPVVGPTVTLGSGDEFEDTTGWTVLSDTTESEGDNHRQTAVYQTTQYMGQDPDPDTDILYSLKSTITKTTLFNPDEVVLERTQQITTQRLIHQSYDLAQIMIYEIGSGNATLDAIVYEESDDGEYVPFIPIRINNNFLSESYEPDMYKLAKKAYKKASGGAKLDDLIESINENEKLNEIDYAYVMYGVSLNIPDEAGKEYIYRFFEKLRQKQNNTTLEYLLWKEAQEEDENATAAYKDWKAAQSDPSSELYGAVIPGGSFGRPLQPKNINRIRSNGTGLDLNVDMSIIWDNIDRTEGTGLKKPDAKPGQYWINKGVDDTGTTDTIQTGRNNLFLSVVRGGNTFQIHHQIDADHWETLTVSGAKHVNTIYNKKSVVTTASDALDDAEDSEFFVPLHMATFNQMSLKNATQFATIGASLVFNCYKVVKKKWYQTGFFAVITFVVIIAITVIFPPAGATAGGVLGSSAAVGAAIGLSGTLALVVGAIINAVAAMIIMKILSAAAILVFGEKLGRIIGAVLSVAGIAIAGGLMNGQSLSAVWGNMMSASSLISLTQAVGNGIAGYMRASAMETVAKTEDLLEKYNKESKDITEKFLKEFGLGEAVIDPLMFTESFANASESASSFLERTLMTGSDIAEMTHDMLTNFTNYTLSLDPAGT